MFGMLRSMIGRLAGENQQQEVEKEKSLLDGFIIESNFPLVGMLVAPIHKPERFYTILNVEMRRPPTEIPEEKTKAVLPQIRLKMLKNEDNKIVESVFFKNPEHFWSYYVNQSGT